MKRSKSGREIYSQNWQNMESTSSKNEDDDDVLHSSSTKAVTETNAQTSEGIRRANISLLNSHDLMYRATLGGDYVAVEMLLERDPNLASVEISQEGDRALHIAAAIKHTEIVRKLVEILSPSDLALLDGKGYTACCYAAMSGVVEIADLMMRKNPTLVAARDRGNKTPLYKAALRRNAEMVSYFLKYAKVEDLSTQEWFDLLLVTIRRKMYGVALQVLGSIEVLAALRNEEGTALHLLARQPFQKTRWKIFIGVMREDMRVLAKKLWEGIQRQLGHASAVELMKNPPILHDAAELGNVELITMITHTYPELVWHTNSEGYTIFHIAVKYRIGNLFVLIKEIGARKDLIAVTQDKNGNNILHLTAKVSPPDATERMLPLFLLQREAKWFKEVKAIVPPLCWEMRNNEEQTPRELFMEHERLLEKNATWTRKTADPLMLISTLILTLLFASAFAVPGGYDDKTRMPILIKSNWFTCFVVFEALAMFMAALSVLWFLKTMMAGDADFTFDLPIMVAAGLAMLSLSVLGAVSVLVSFYFLVFAEEKGALVKSVIVILYIMLVSAVILETFDFYGGLSMPLFPKRNRHSLFQRPVGDTIVTCENEHRSGNAYT